MERKVILCEMVCRGKGTYVFSEKNYEKVEFEMTENGLMNREFGTYAKFIFAKSDEIKPGDRFTLVLERIQQRP